MDEQEAYLRSLDEQPQAAAASGKGGGAGSSVGGLLGGGGGGGVGDLIQNVGKTAMAVYQAKLKKQEEARKRSDIMQELSRNMGDKAANTAMGSTIHNTNELSSAFLKDLIG